MKIANAFTAIAAVATLSAAAVAGPGYFQGFEDASFAPGDPNDWNNNSGGEIARVLSGTNGITSASGNAHATIGNLQTGTDVFGNPSLGAGNVFTRLGGYTSNFDGGFVASQDIYLDTSWTQGQGFDFSTAASKSDGSHLRDFIWHVGVTSSGLTVNASNNTDFNFNSFKLDNENGGSNFAVTADGWYTFETVFFDNGGTLAVEYNLIDSNGTTVYTVTRTTTDAIAGVGGNRYGWFTYNNIDGLAIDNTTLSARAIPMPTPLAMAGLGFAGVVGTRRRR